MEIEISQNGFMDTQLTKVFKKIGEVDIYTARNGRKCGIFKLVILWGLFNVSSMLQETQIMNITVEIRRNNEIIHKFNTDTVGQVSILYTDQLICPNCPIHYEIFVASNTEDTKLEGTTSFVAEVFNIEC
ncbi:hypothetical protein [Bacillus thuringiensis]|uniref:hypothetical protein n=1 Tax=Bacillus thuringiensis TaxID=1428 RepID=UPI003B985693